jgi:ketosteroid isomerase-like protein
MSEESTTPGPGDLVRGFLESADRGEFGESLRFYSADAVFDMSPVGLGVYEGPEAIRRFYEDWMGAYDDSDILIEKVLALDGDIVLACSARTRVRKTAAIACACGQRGYTSGSRLGSCE